MLVILWGLALVSLLGGFGGAIYKRFFSDGEASNKVSGLLTAVGVFGLFLIVVCSGSTSVSPTGYGVGENTWTGELFLVRPGTHIYPFNPKLVPFLTHVTEYNLKKIPLITPTIEADSASPGRPNVDLECGLWASPNPNTLLALHKTYGKDWTDWVIQQWISTIKAYQGSRAYDHVGNYRSEMENAIEYNLQMELLLSSLDRSFDLSSVIGSIYGYDPVLLASDTKTNVQTGSETLDDVLLVTAIEDLIPDGDVPIIFVSEHKVSNFEFPNDIQAYLKNVAELEFSRQQAEQTIEVNQQLQEAARIEADTDYNVRVRAAEAKKEEDILNSEAEKQKAILDAEGAAEAKILAADAEAYSIAAVKQAEADGIAAIQEAMAINPDAYNDLVARQTWNGMLPQYYWVGADSSGVSLFNIPMGN